MGNMIKGLLVLIVIVIAAGFALGYFYPEKIPRQLQSVLKKADSGIEQVEGIIPGYLDEEEKRMREIAEENKRIALEESLKMQRLGQEKADYEFNKAFDKWYAIPEDCKNTKNARTISLCVNNKRAAKEEFTEIWNARNNPH